MVSQDFQETFLGLKIARKHLKETNFFVGKERSS